MKGRKSKYRTAKALERAIQAYVRRYSRVVPFTEEYDTGERDDKGHTITGQRPVLAEDGEPVTYRAWAIPPNVGGLCRELGISRQTWSEYCDPARHPEFAEATEWIRDLMQTWLEEQLLTRPDKELKGIIFNLENNYRYRQHVEVHGVSTMEDLLGIGKDSNAEAGAQDATPEF